MRRHLTYANVMASIAVFIALGGVSYAAGVRIPSNSVGSKQLKKNAVLSSKIKARQVTGTKVALDTLTGAQIKESTLTTVPRAKAAVTATKATNADNATKAATAATATRAGTADSAANADKLNGVTAAELRDKCPAGTVLASGMCIELKDHSTTTATYSAAGQACSTVGGRPPTWFELELFRQLPNVEWAAGNGLNQYEWTSDQGTGNLTVLARDYGGNELDGMPGNAYYYRCAIYPTNR